MERAPPAGGGGGGRWRMWPREGGFSLPGCESRPVVIVDLDDTLIPDRAAAREAVARTLRALGLPDGRSEVDLVFSVARERWHAEPGRRHPELERVSSWEALWVPEGDPALPRDVARTLAGHDRRVWRDALAALDGADRDPAEAAQRFRCHRIGLTRPLPGAPAALEALRERHVLWLATDGCRTLQRAKLRWSGLEHHFARVFVSGEVGHPKSAPGFGEVLRARLDAEGRGVCMLVGDSAAKDIAPAVRHGWRAVHVCGAPDCTDATEATVHCVSFALVPAACRC